MSLITPEYRAELSALLSRSTATPVHLSKGGSLGTRSRLVEKAFSEYDPTVRLYVNEDCSAATYTPMRIQGGKALLAFDERQMASLFGRCPMRFAEISIGPHPDFRQLDFNYTVEHYCVSMFVDMVGSTKLATLGYDLLEIRRIKDTVLSLFIQVANFFGGHVHRLQGDAAFLQFVRVGQEPSDCAINALNAASLICYFVTHFFADQFRENNLDPLAVRVGIDYGAKDQVLWSHYGLPGCSELTTTSTYTDLAAKLQAGANANEVRIGHNLRQLLDLPSEFAVLPLKDGKFDQYILPELQYQQYDFNWRAYLCSYDFVTLDSRTKRLVIDSNPDRFRLLCEVYADALVYAQPEGQYAQNARALPKGKGLIFRIIENQYPYQRRSLHVVTWEIDNRGTEAAADADKSWKNPQPDTSFTPTLKTGTSYKGHHYMRCRIQRPGQPDMNLRLPVFVGDYAAVQLLNS
jgi:adenylate cyclase